MSVGEGPRQQPGSDDASKACRELDRLQKVLEDAVPALMSSFERIAELAAAQSALLEESLAPADDDTAGEPAAEETVPAAKLKLARTYDEHIRHHLNAVVISLQFEDLALQLIAHLRKRIRRIGGEPAQAHEKDKARDEKDKAWGQRTYGPVSGEGLTSGSVDLF